MIRARVRLRRDERGVMALATALMISAVLFLAGMLSFQVASSNQSDASLRRIQSQALYAAESGLNRAYQAMQSAASASQLPCGSNLFQESLTSSPSPSSFSVQIQYYGTFPVSGAALGCPAPASTEAAEVVATGTAGANTAQATHEYMEALVKVDPGSTTGGVFDQALFSNSTMTGSNNPTVYGYSGDDADVYSNGNITCGNSFVVQGSVTAQGSFSGSNNCTVDGNVTAVGNISMSNNTAILGNATSTGGTGCSQVGNITMSNNAAVDQSAFAYCSISLSNQASVAHSTVPHDTTLTNPTVETFPSVPDPSGSSTAAAAWTSAGYTNQESPTTCAQAYTDISNMATATAPTVIMTSCALTWANNSSVSLAKPLAIFSTGGFSMANNTSWQSTSSTVQDLYLIVPSAVGSTATTCSNGAPGITFSNNTSFANTVDVLDYTPCTITISNSTTGYGQVYGGQTIDVSNNFTTHFVPMVVPGATGGGQTTSTTTIAVVYERQLSSPADA